MTTKRNRARGGRCCAYGMLTLAVFIGMAVPAWGTPPDCNAARNIYAENCAVCHMDNGKGNDVLKTPDFTDPKWQAEHKDPELIDAVLNGVKLTAMPPWKGMLKPAEIDALIKCVVRGFGKKTAPAHHPSTTHPHAS